MGGMNKNIVAVFVIGLWVPFSVLAESADYQTEISFSKKNIDEDGGGQTKYTGVAFEYYFNKVEPSAGPLNEALFLQRVSSLGLEYLTVDDHSSGYPDDGDAKAIVYNYRDKVSPYSFGLLYIDLKVDPTSNGYFKINAEGKTKGIALAYYLDGSTGIGMVYQETDYSYSIGEVALPDSKSKESYAEGKKLIQRSDATAINLEAEAGIFKDGGDRNTFIEIKRPAMSNISRAVPRRCGVNILSPRGFQPAW